MLVSMWCLLCETEQATGMWCIKLCILYSVTCVAAAANCPNWASMGLRRACAEPHLALFDPADLEGCTTVTAASLAAVTLAACSSLPAV